MKVTVGKVLVDIDNETIKDLKGNNATAKGVIIEALLATYNDEQNLSGEDKLKRFELALKIKNTNEVVIELNTEEIVLIKKLVGRAFGTIIVGQTWKVLEGE